jgi:hypothetical protein
MKILASLVFLFSLSIAIGCSKPIQLDSNLIMLKVKDCSNLNYFPGKISICFDSLLTDSRCPQGALCVWEGFAAGRFSFTANNQTSVFDLSATHDVYNQYTTDTVIAGYKIEFTELNPYPNISVPPPATGKTATLRITKQ